MPGLKINSIKASGFLSFENIEINNLSESVNFIVGPNGSGKTNFIRLIDFIKKAILIPWNFPYYTDIKTYLKKDFHRLKLEIDTEFILSDEEIENVYTIIAILFFDKIISTVLNNYHLSLGDAITFFKSLWNEKFKKGKLIIEYDDVSKNSKIFFKLVNEETIALDLVNNLLITGYNEEHYDEHRNDFSSKTDVEKIFLMGEIFNNNINTWSRQDTKYLLLSENLNQYGKYNNVKEESGMISKAINFIDNFLIKDAQIGLPAGTNRVSISTIFSWIFENSIITLDNFRCPSKNDLSIKEIIETLNFQGNNIYPYLLQLKINKIDDYNEIKKVFKELSNNKDFDIKIKDINDFQNKTQVFPISSIQTEAQVQQNISSVDVSVIDHRSKLELYFKDSGNSEEYPFELSPAGYYETLLLSTAIAGNKNKIVILDEPAQNLHPTLQHKLSLEINNHSKNDNNQFFIITHSPDLVKIDKEPIKNVFIFRQKNKATFIDKFEPDNSDKMKFFKYEELKRLFFVKGIILVEGFSEEILMNRLIRNLIFFENAKKDSNNEDSENTVNLGDIEVVNIEGVNSLMNFICLTFRLNLPYVAMIDDDIFDPKSKIFKDNKGNNAKNIIERLGLDYEDNLNNGFKEAIEKLKDDYHVCFAKPNFEGHVDEDFKDYSGFEENYLNWCKEKFGSMDSECNEHKKTNYPLYLTEKEDIFSEIVRGDKLKIYSDGLKDIIEQING